MTASTPSCHDGRAGSTPVVAAMRKLKATWKMVEENQFTEENRKKVLEIWEKAMRQCMVGDRLPTKEEVEYGKTLAEYAKSKKVN